MSFSNLKRSRKSAFEQLTKAVETATKSNTRSADERFWKPTVDASGNGSAIIRFLPPAEGEDVPFVRYWDHGFQGPGGWYIEKSLTTIGQDDPVSEMNGQLWATGVKANRELVSRDRKRRLHYVSNIYVIKDPANPSNEGKVFLYEYGKKIFDKINDLMHPEFEDETAVNPFDLWEGADFRLRIRKYEGYRNYDKSEFDSPSELLDGDDEKLEKVYNQLFELQEFVDPKNFKSYAELEARLARVLGPAGSAAAAHAADGDEQAPAWSPPAAEAKESEQAPWDAGSDDEDGDLKYFQDLAS